MTKTELRSLYKGMRRELDDFQQSVLDENILRGLKRLNWSEVKVLHIYLPIRKSNEPDTLKFMQWLRSIQPEIQFVISRSDFDTNTMTHYLWDDHMVLEVNRWGILEPKEGILVSEDELDAVLVPLLVVDRRGNRVGYGKGFYDRFLEKCKPDLVTVGISYFEPVDQIDDVGKWDVPLKYAVTPSGIYQF